MPCLYSSTKEAAYHMCHPWGTGVAIYIVVAAEVCLMLAVCFGGCILTQGEEDRIRKRRNHGRIDQ